MLIKKKLFLKNKNSNQVLISGSIFQNNCDE